MKQVSVMEETMKSIREFRNKSVDQTEMLKEDQVGTTSLKQDLVF